MITFPYKIHTYLRDALFAKRGATVLPKDMPTYLSKEYARMPKVQLPIPESQILLRDVLENRTSCRANNINQKISLKQYGELLGLALQERPDKHRPYPSGGGLYPVETYLVVTMSGDTRPTAYHYQPKTHVLERLWELPTGMEVSELFLKQDVLDVTGCVILTARWHRTVPKYGDFGYVLALLEAGHIGQNLLLSAVAAEICACPMGGFIDEKITEVLDLHKYDEQTVYCIAISATV